MKLFMILLLSSCMNTNKSSQFKWIPTASNEAILEKEDINQEFVIDLKVIDIDPLLPIQFRSFSYKQEVKSSVTDVNYVNSAGEQIQFTEISFGSLKFPMRLNENNDYIIEFEKADLFANLNVTDESWKEIGIVNVQVSSIGRKNIEANLVYKLKNQDGKEANITFAMSLNKLNLEQSVDQQFESRNYEQGIENGIGYFSTNINLPHLKNNKIYRFSKPTNNRKIIFYLENFPQSVQKESIETIKKWNKAFNSDVIDVLVSEGISKWGDRKYNVIRWKDLGDSGLLGIANHRFAFPTGQIYSAQIQINSYYFDSIKERVELNFKHLNRISYINSTNTVEFENKFNLIPFGSHLDYKDSEQAVKKYYSETLLHEVGHALGLTHNFKGSLHVDERNQFSSIMDYHPRYIRQSKEPNIGNYDMDAIRWGYFGKMPAKKFEYCEEKLLNSDWECNIGDYGHPLDFLEQSILDFSRFFKTLDIEIKSDDELEHLISMMNASIELYYKLTSLDLPIEYHKRVKNLKINWGDFWNIQLQGIQGQNFDMLSEKLKPFIDCMEENGFQRRYLCDDI